MAGIAGLDFVTDIVSLIGNKWKSNVLFVAIPERL